MLNKRKAPMQKWQQKDKIFQKMLDSLQALHAKFPVHTHPEVQNCRKAFDTMLHELGEFEKANKKQKYDIDEFVNTFTANVEFDGNLFDNDEDKMQKQFESDFKFNRVNEDAAPVLVYELRGKAIGWYDTEMLVGYKS
jgi:hypothetical protein